MEAVLNAERKRFEEIIALAKRHNLDSTQAIKDGITIEAYRVIVLEKILNQKLPEFENKEDKIGEDKNVST